MDTVSNTWQQLTTQPIKEILQYCLNLLETKNPRKGEKGSLCALYKYHLLYFLYA